MTYNFIKVYFINENTVSHNEYFNRNNDPVEVAILPYLGGMDDYRASDILDDFLACVCYCDEYTFDRYEVLQGADLERAQDVFYELSDFAECCDRGEDSEKPHEAEFIYQFNAIMSHFMR